MPELPEVETIRGDLQKTLVGREILGVETGSPKQIQPSLAVVQKGVVGATIKEIKRRAKLLQIFLGNGRILVIHLKLTGRLLIRKAGSPKDEWQHAIFKLKAQNPKRKTKSQNSKVENGDLELRFCDLRKFGWIRLVENERELDGLLAELGPEPLTSEFTLEKFKEILSKWGRPIKILLMDQKKIAGVGNIYANDALFLAGISPQKRGRDISPEKAKKLYETLNQVLKEGIKYRGASDQAYLDAFGKAGHYQEHFRVYGQKGKPCPNKCGGIIRRMTLGGRGAFFCPACQR